MPDSTPIEQDDPDDLRALSPGLEEKIAFIRSHAPLDKTQEVEARLQDILQDFRDPSRDYGVDGLNFRLEQLQEVVLFFKSTLAAFEEKFGSRSGSENLKLLQDGFSQRCDLREASMQDLINLRERLEEKFALILETKESIGETMKQQDLASWFNRLMKAWKERDLHTEDLQNELQALLQQRESENQEAQQRREETLALIDACLVFTEAQKKRRREKIWDAAPEKLPQLLAKTQKEITAREQAARAYFETHVHPLIASEPSQARINLRKLRRKYGYNVYTFLDIEALPSALNDIDRLQKEAHSLSRRAQALSQESQQVHQRLHQIHDRIQDLTGQKQFVFPELSEETESPSSTPSSEHPEGVESLEILTQIRALEKMQKLIQGPWMEEASRCRPAKRQPHETVGQEYVQEIMEEETTYARNSRVKFLQQHEDIHGENLWDKTQRLEKICPYEMTRDETVTEVTYYSREMKIPLRQLTAQKAEALEKQIDTYMSGPHELIFLTGNFVLDPEYQKIKPASTVREVLPAINQKLSELRNQLSRPIPATESGPQSSKTRSLGNAA